MLVIGILDSSLVAADPEADRPRNAAWLGLGGAAAAVEALAYIELVLSSPPSPANRYRSHPPVHFRWDAIRQFVLSIVPASDSKSVESLAGLIASLSHETMSNVFR